MLMRVKVAVLHALKVEGGLLLVLITEESPGTELAEAHVETTLAFWCLCRGSRQHSLHTCLPAMHASATSGLLVGRGQGSDKLLARGGGVSRAGCPLLPCTAPTECQHGVCRGGGPSAATTLPARLRSPWTTSPTTWGT